MVGHGVQKVTVVRNQQQGALIAFEPAFQPQHGIEVEVVGRFIEQKQVGTAHQRPAEIESDAPAA